jgi:1,4-dihydroxy-6-naphthoate synthase
MFYGLATHKLDTGTLNFQHLLKDIQTLNEEAMRGTYDVTAISFHAYAYIHDKYALLPHGASIGDNYGPILVSRHPATPADIPKLKIAIPGKLTSAFLALRIFNSEFAYEVVPFDRIIDAVQDGTCDAGLLIHEGQLTYGDRGLHLWADLGEWWHQETGLPLPLGGNVVRRDLGDALLGAVARDVKASIEYGLAHRSEALAHAQTFSRGLDPAKTDRFVGMYVNDYTVDYGERGRLAVRELLERGHRAGIVPGPVPLHFVAG